MNYTNKKKELFNLIHNNKLKQKSQITINKEKGYDNSINYNVKYNDGYSFVILNKLNDIIDHKDNYGFYITKGFNNGYIVTIDFIIELVKPELLHNHREERLKKLYER